MRRRRVVHGDHIYVPGLPGLRRPEACGEDLPFYVPHLRHGGLSGPFLPESGPASSPAGKNGSGRPAPAPWTEEHGAYFYCGICDREAPPLP